MLHLSLSVMQQRAFHLHVHVNPHFYSSRTTFSATDHPIHFIFGSRVGFSRSVDRVTLLAVLENPKWRPAAILENVEWPHLCNGSCNSLRVWFYGRVFGSADRCMVGPNSRSRPSLQPSCIIFNGHISETVRPVQYVFGSRVKV